MAITISCSHLHGRILHLMALIHLLAVLVDVSLTAATLQTLSVRYVHNADSWCRSLNLNPELDGERLLEGANFASAGVGILGFEQRLYDLGARRVIVTGTGPIGCVPAEIAQRGRNGECAVELQQAAGLFNPQLVQTILELNSELGSDVFTFHGAGFVTSKVACCGQGPFNGIGLCTVLSNLCPNRDLYAFWDAFHPSDRANQFIVDQFMIGSNKVMNPMNLSTMLALDSRT